MKIIRFLSLFILLMSSLVACDGGQSGDVSAIDNGEAVTLLEPTPTTGAADSINAASDDNLAAENATDQPADTSDAAVSNGTMPGCTVVSFPIDDAAQNWPVPRTTASEWFYGPSDAPVTIVIYNDFQCEACAQWAALLKQLQTDFPEHLRIVHRHFPQVDINDKATLAVQAVEAAGHQGAFWQMHDILYQKQVEWFGLPADLFRDWATTIAGELGLNVEQFGGAIISTTYIELGQQSYQDARDLGIAFAPYVIIEGRIYNGPADYNSLTSIINLLLLPEIQYNECPPLVIDVEKTYFATIELELGNVHIELLPKLAPLAVNNFVFLAREGWFEGITFHRMIPGFMAQAGDPSGTGFGGPGYAFENEDAGILFNNAGLVAMANAGRDTNGSQFFITLGPAGHLDGDFTIFGLVIEGMDIIAQLTPRNPEQNSNLPPGDRIIRITIEEN